MIRQEGLEALRAAIIAEAHYEAADEIRAAELSAASTRAAATVKLRQERDAILGRARQDAEVLARRIRSIADVETKRQLLEQRERLIGRVLDDARQLLRQPLPVPEERELLLRLIVEAGQKIGGGAISVHVSPADAALLPTETLEEAARRLQASGLEARLTLAEHPLPITAGAILTKDAGRVLVDNTIEARLARREDALRGEIWRMLSAEE